MKYLIQIQHFGGRGASAGGRISGGGTGVNIVSTESLVSMRNDGVSQTEIAKNKKMVDDVLSTTKWYKDNFGGEAYDLSVAELDAKDANVMGFCSQDSSVSINETFFHDEITSKVYDETAKTGFHPGRGDKTGLQAVVAHEMGHVMNHRLADFVGKDYAVVAENVVSASRKMLGIQGNVIMARGISQYATQSNKETIAEAYADYYCNGIKAKLNSRAIIYTMSKELSGYKKSGVSKPNVKAFFTEKEYNEIEKRMTKTKK